MVLSFKKAQDLYLKDLQSMKTKIYPFLWVKTSEL